MDTYFNENRIIGKASVSHNGREKRLEGMKIRGNIKEGIRLVVRYGKDMQRAITVGNEYTKEVIFTYLEMIGMKRYVKERRKYGRLLETLNKLKVTLVMK